MLKNKDLVEHEDYPNRVWAVLEVTQERFDNTDINVESPGLYAFAGMWYGEDKFDINSYGKVLPLTKKFKKLVKENKNVLTHNLP